MSCLFHLWVFVCRADILEYAVWLEIEIHMVQTNCVEPEIGDVVCHYLGLFFVRETCVDAKVRTSELRAGAVTEIKMAVFDLDETMFAGWRAEDVLAGVERRCRDALIIRRLRRIRGEVVRKPAFLGTGNPKGQ